MSASISRRASSGVAIGAGLLTKGPPALIPVAWLVGVIAYDRAWKRSRPVWQVAGIALAVALALAWLLPAVSAYPQWNDNINKEVFERVSGQGSGAGRDTPILAIPGYFMGRFAPWSILFAVAAVLVTGLLAWVAYHGVRNALAEEFGRRLEALARTAASQVSGDDIRDTQLLGEDGNGYLTLQVLLEELRSATGLVSAAALDSAGTLLYDTRGAEHQGERSPLGTLSPDALTHALGGRHLVTPIYREAGQLEEAAEAFRKSLENDPQGRWVIKQLAEVEKLLAEEKTP